MTRESTELGQDKEKIARLVGELHTLFDAAYPGEEHTGLELFEVLDVLALYPLYPVTSVPPKLEATALEIF